MLSKLPSNWRAKLRIAATSSHGYHGLSAGALATTGNRHFRTEAFVNRSDVSFMPFEGYFGPQVNTLEYLRRFLADTSSGVDVPAAIIVETVQAEGGITNRRSSLWSYAGRFR